MKIRPRWMCDLDARGRKTGIFSVSGWTKRQKQASSSTIDCNGYISSAALAQQSRQQTTSLDTQQAIRLTVCQLHVFCRKNSFVIWLLLYHSFSVHFNFRLFSLLVTTQNCGGEEWCVYVVFRCLPIWHISKTMPYTYDNWHSCACPLYLCYKHQLRFGTLDKQSITGL